MACPNPLSGLLGENLPPKTTARTATPAPSNGSTGTIAPVYTQSIFGGSGYGRLHGSRRHFNYGYNGIGLGLGVNYVPYPSARVDFENDRVVRWNQGSRR